MKNTFDFFNGKPKLCTLDSAKGLEFDIVIMPQMNQALLENRSRIFIGMTRAGASSS